MSKIITVLDTNKKPFRLHANECRDWAFRASRADVSRAIRSRLAGCFTSLPITKHNMTSKASGLVDSTAVVVYLTDRELHFGCHRFGARASATIRKWARGIVEEIGHE